MDLLHFAHLIYGKDIRKEPRGWTALPCPACQTLRPMRIRESWQKDKLFHIEVSDTLIDRSITCDFCQTRFRIGKEMRFATFPDWAPEDGFQLLVDKTAPAFGKIEEPTSQSDLALSALLNSLNRKKSIFCNDVTLGVVFGICGMLPLIFILFHLQFKFGGYALVCYVLFLAAGGLLGALAYARLKGKFLAQDTLRECMGKYQIDLDRLSFLAERKGRFVRSIIADFREKK